MPQSPTKQQKTAIEADVFSPSIVTASAGTGKTTMIVERVLRLISDSKSGVSADRLAIMTFTVNATQNLRDKLNSELSARIAELSESGDKKQRDFLSEQMIKLRSASISTIDAFCLSLIRENVERFGLPQAFSIADSARRVQNTAAAINMTREAFYEEFSDEERGALFYSFSFEDDEELFDTVMSVHTKLSSFSDSRKWLDDAVSSYESIENYENTFLPPYVSFVEKTCVTAEKLIDNYEELLKLIAEDVKELEQAENAEKHRKAYEKLLSVKEYARHDEKKLRQLIEAGKIFLGSPSLRTLSEIFKKIGKPEKNDVKIPRGSDTEHTKQFTALKNYVEKFFEKFVKYSVSEQSEAEMLPKRRLCAAAFAKLLRKYSEIYSEIKISSGFIDFSDCELLLLEKLREDEEFRSSLAKRFSCVIVDEFQDSNDVQAEIFSLIGGKNLFYVGDVKQSIYAFRGGNPEIMERLCEGKDGFTAYPLTENFRSRKPVVDAVNAAFKGLMTAKYGGTNYGENGSELHFSAKFPEIPQEFAHKYEPEIHIFGGAEGSREDAVLSRARFTAAKIRGLMLDENFKITRGGELVRPRPSDFIILMRNKKDMEIYAKALAEMNFDSSLPNGGDLFDSIEITTMINFLKVVDNPLLDKETAAVLMSPIYRLTADETARLRLGIAGFEETPQTKKFLDEISRNMRRSSMFSCVNFCTENDFSQEENYSRSEKLKKAQDIVKELASVGIFRAKLPKTEIFRRDLEQLRQFMYNNSAAGLIRKICELTDFYAALSALGDSKRRISNLRQFEKTAEDFCSRSGGGLCDFLRFISRLEENGEMQSEQTSAPESAENCVNIMTFHAGKGLEAPVCILTELQTKFKTDGAADRFRFNRDYFYSIEYLDRKTRFRAKGLSDNAILLANSEKPVGEELRLLYVAMTRAREKLIMIGDFPAQTPEELGEPYSDSTPFKWILQKLWTSGITPSFEGYSDCFGNDISDEGKNQNIEVPVTENDLRAAENIRRRCAEKYHNQAETSLHASLTVTELSHRNSSFPFVLTRPRFNKTAEGTDYGNAYHHAMQFISLEKMRGARDIYGAVKDELSAMAAKKRLSEEERSLIDPKKIAMFFSGELGKRMLESRRVEREFRFYAEISGEEIGVPDIGRTSIKGQIDMFFEENGEIIIVDYKSDATESFAEERENYALQVRTYAAVARKIFGKNVRENYLYSFSMGKAVKI